MFSSIIIYEYNNLEAVVYEYNVFRLKLWYLLSNLNIKEELSLKINAYDPQYFMPS